MEKTALSGSEMKKQDREKCVKMEENENKYSR